MPTTFLDLYLRMTKIYGTNHPIVKQFCQLSKNSDIKIQHLRTIVECHEEEHKKIVKNT